jgi:hypothetical protein
MATRLFSPLLIINGDSDLFSPLPFREGIQGRGEAGRAIRDLSTRLTPVEEEGRGAPAAAAGRALTEC